MPNSVKLQLGAYSSMVRATVFGTVDASSILARRTTSVVILNNEEILSGNSRLVSLGLSKFQKACPVRQLN